MFSDTFQVDRTIIHYLKFGQGEKILIALHGFADTAAQFTILEKVLSAEYTIYAIDLPYHGKTIWPASTYTPQDISIAIKNILKVENKQHFDIMGFSFGGRIALLLLEEWQEKIKKIFLLAPDGLQTRYLSSLHRMPQLFKNRLLLHMHRPKAFLRLSSFLLKLGMMSQFGHNFMQHHLLDDANKTRLINTWQSVENFKISLWKIEKIFQNNPIPIVMFLGKYDKVIPIRIGNMLRRHIPHIRIVILPSNHRKMIRALSIYWLKKFEN